MNHRASKTWPLIVTVLLGHLFVPLIFIAQMFNTHSHDLLAWLLSFYIVCSYLLFIFLSGAWSWFGKGIRFGIPVLFVVASVISFPHAYQPLSISAMGSFEYILSFCIGSFFFVMFIKAVWRRRVSTAGIKLAFPLQSGTYIIAQGGSTKVINLHRTSASQRYAMDVLKLNRWGVRASGFYPAELTKYAIWNDEVFSPCDGIVAAAEDGFEDLIPPKRDPEHRAGNFVAIEYDNATVYLAHLKKGTVCVNAGEKVKTGQLLGRIGNSGNTSEPHLHIHAEQGSYPGHFSGNPGIPMFFNGRFLVRNDYMKSGKNNR